MDTATGIAITSFLVWIISVTLALGQPRLSDTVYRGTAIVCAGFLLGFILYRGCAGPRALWV